MEPSLIRRLESLAASMLPPAVMMCIECAADATGAPALSALLEEAQTAGLSGLPLCREPCETIVFDDRVLLRCGGCPRAAGMPHFTAVGRGRTHEEALRNALYALTLPPVSGRKERGCLATMSWGEGPAEASVTSCPWIRCAWAHGTR